MLKFFTHKIILVVCLVLSLSSGAAEINNFSERFKVVREEEGKLVKIVDRVARKKFSIGLYLEFIKEALLEEQALMLDNENYAAHIEEFLEREFDDEELNENLYEGKGGTLGRGVQGKFLSRKQVILSSLQGLGKVDIEALFNNSKFKKLMIRFEKRLSKALDQIDPRILAYPHDSKFFYRRAMTYQIVIWGLDLAKRFTSSLPVLNTISYILVKVERLIRERRMFHQNRLLHYLENFNAEDLGLSHEEANLVFSSIYESRIPWSGFKESKAAQNGWKQYGTNHFYARIRQANNKLRGFKSKYDAVGERLNYSFQSAQYKGREVILNLYNGDNMFQTRPAIAFDREDSHRVLRKRMLIHLAEFGLSFITLPNWIKGNVESYLKSFYEKQRLTEGALFAYFETQGRDDLARIIGLQYMNPFDILDFSNGLE